MRTLIDLPEKQLKALAMMGVQQHLSRAALVRRAIDFYLEKQNTFCEDDVFGLWSDRDIESLAYEKKLRDEWGS